MAEEIIPVREHFYILSTSSRIDDRTGVLKHGDTFAVFDRYGDVEQFGAGELGIYHQDTRFLSRLTLKIDGGRPLLLSSTIKDNNATLVVDSMNPDIRLDGQEDIRKGTLHLFRSKFLWNAACYERFRIRNHGRIPVNLHFSLLYDADFADIFEVRGSRRESRGLRLPPKLKSDTVMFTYEGLDNRIRRTRILCSPQPRVLTETEAIYDLQLCPGEDKEYQCMVFCEINEKITRQWPAAQTSRYDEASSQAEDARDKMRSNRPVITTSNGQFNNWMSRSIADLDMMRTETEYGPFPYAGVPWFCTAFGRDGIITALECLTFYPELARGVLSYLGSMQAQGDDAEKDAEPGKIMHETRSGEMATLGEVPYGCYYGSVDSTPLFIILAEAYYERTGDRQFAESLWPHIERGLIWIDKYGDRDGDGFVEYARRSANGLTQQGWRDSEDSAFHDDGTPVQGPIALCEVQGYVYAAKIAAGRIASLLGHDSRARLLEKDASILRKKFEESFWCDDLDTYALALDGSKRPARVRASSAGHCLFCGIASHDHAQRIAALLASDIFFSGWGVRTVATSEALYNPMSYHNGSIWPHDNALIAAGFARYGFKEKAIRILNGLLDATVFFDQHRLPELFCGFRKRTGQAPTLYPVACAPQAWASGAVYLLLQSCLGLKVLGSEHKVIFSNPHLPASLRQVSIQNLHIQDATIDLLATRHEGDVGINVMRRYGHVDVVVLK
ncbi:MAG: amylo-alpha-1,6-glucosidase [Syntrophorhabdaceae bacterium]